MEEFENFLDLYRRSPLGKRSKQYVRLLDVLSKFFGYNSDHCSKEKKSARLMAEKKINAAREKLGEDVAGQKSLSEIETVYQEEKSKILEEVGGADAWDALPATERSEREAEILTNVLLAFGEEEFSKLSDEEKRHLEFFIWVGCGCHKELNTMKCGNVAMMLFWDEHGLAGPILLANRDNAAVINNIKDLESLSPAEQRALDVTIRGAVKAASIAGYMFNHKDDKKGQQDTYKWWFEKCGIKLNFPDTSSTRYQSYCEAASVLIEHLQRFLEFLLFVRDKKEKRRFTHMEDNLYRALQCQSTITELAVLTMYSQAITHPYISQIRTAEAEKGNMLDMGPLHEKVGQHMEKIMENPKLLISKDATYKTGTLDGKMWNRPGAVAAVLEIAPTLPYLEGALLEFFKGALEGWKRFTSEFAEGGLIDTSTATERDLAWMPPTNDANEGILGTYRVFMRNKPSTSLHQFNAQAMFHRNDTALFMDEEFTPDDHAYIRKAAREADGSGLERQRRKVIIEHGEKEVELKREKDKARAEKDAAKVTRVSKVVLILDRTKVADLKGKALHDQYDAFQAAGGPVPKVKPKTVGPKKKAIEAMIDALDAGTWELSVDIVQEASNSEPVGDNLDGTHEGDSNTEDEE